MLKIGVLICLIVAASGADQALEDFSKGNEKFSSDLVKIVSRDDHDKGIISPLSAEVILALTAEGARGQTESELRRALSLPDKQTTRSAIKSLIPLLNKSNNSFTLALANKIYIGKEFKVKEEFKKVAVSDYQTEVENVQFADSAKTTKLINDWVANKTNNKIKDLIRSDQLNAKTRLVLVNTLYLNGKWETPFPTSKTTKKPFNFASKKKGEVDTMHSADNAKYLFFHCGYLKAKFLEIPYKDSTVSATFVLPDAQDGLAKIEQDLQPYLKPHNLTLQRVAVSLPKFSAETLHDFKEILEELGVSRVFNADEADLSDLSSEKGLYVDFVQQKAFINITESGTEAAAATAVGVGTVSIIQPLRLIFNADHPFLFFIRESKSNAILFVSHFR